MNTTNRAVVRSVKARYEYLRRLSQAGRPV
jgi:hypothetical protein